MKYPELIEQMTLEEKIRMVTGDGAWHTYSIDRLGIRGIMMTDGPHGLRKVYAEKHGDIENGILINAI